jgi:ADP-heptose:LPS heptosyltransferase
VADLAGQPGGAPPEDALPQFVAEARAYRYDLAVQLHGRGAASNPLVRALRARWSIGLRTQDAPPLDATVPYRYYQSEVFRVLEVVALVGAEGAGRSTPSWRCRSRSATPPRTCCPGTLPGWVCTRARVIAPACSHTTVPLHDLTGRTDLGTLAAVLRRCAVVVANDSGPLHLARAVGPATVGLYWCGNAINAASTVRTRHRPLLSWVVHCPVCGTDTSTAGFPHRPGDGCAHRPSFLDQIPVVEVLEEVLDLLDRTRSDTTQARQPA